MTFFHTSEHQERNAMGKPLQVLIIFFDDFYDVGLGCASTIALALILPGLSKKIKGPQYRKKFGVLITPC